MVENLLSKLLVIPNFLGRAECERLIADLDSRAAVEDLNIYSGRQLPLTPEFTIGDLAEPLALLETARTSQAAAVVVASYLAPEAMDKMGSVKDASGLDELLGVYVVDAFNRAVADAGLIEKLAVFVDAKAIAALQERRRELDNVEGDPAQRLALAWLNIDALQELVFQRGLSKVNRFFRLDTDRRRVVERLSNAPAIEPSLPPFARWLPSGAARERFIDLQFGIRSVFSEAGVRWEFLKSYLPGVAKHLAPAARSAAEALLGGGTRNEDTECALAWMTLQLFLPEDSLPFAALSTSVVKGIRNTQTVTLGDSAPTYFAYLQRLATEFAEPYYGIHIVPNFNDFNVLRYDPGGFFLNHCDSEKLVLVDGRKSYVKWSPRDVSILLYLSDPSTFEGGAVTFSDQHVTVRPQQGMALLFPSDHRFPHGAEPVTKGRRYAIVAWLQCREGGPVGEASPVTW
jgi:hypothetical protein